MAKTKYLIQIVPYLYMNYVLGKFEGQRYICQYANIFYLTSSNKHETYISYKSIIIPNFITVFKINHNFG